MNKRKMPVEIAGYVTRLICRMDFSTDAFQWRWMSVINDNYADCEYLPWDEDSSADNCPF